MNWNKKLAKEKDDGTYTILGMMHQCASYFNVDITSECVSYIVDTYLECINSFPFLEWIRGAIPSEKVIVMDKKFLKEYFNDLLTYSEDLEVLQDLFMYLYGQEIWVDKKAKVLYSTVFNLSFKDRNKFDFTGIAMSYERLATLREFQIVNWSDIDDCVNRLSQYGYDIENDYRYRTNNVDETADNIIDRINHIFPSLQYK